MHHVCFAEPWNERAMNEVLAMPGTFGLLATGEETSDAQSRGFILCRVAGGEAEVLTLMVLPPYRRRGVARSLLGASIAQARLAGASALFLEVAADNSKARALYSALEFVEVGRRPRYYTGAIDALVLRRDV
jgi:ribosomal-protein-alanine N-acetyltransferase